MPERKKQGQAFEQALSDLGLEGEYSRLIRLAVVNGWTQTEFLTHIAATRQFRRQFPGLIVDGEINPGFAAGGNLLVAIDRYNQMAFQYEQMAGEYGVKVTRQLRGALVKNNVAPEEFQRRLQVNESIRSNPNLINAINEQLKAFGKAPLDAMGFRQFIAGTGNRDFYDIYEAARLRQAGLNISPLEAGELARSIGEPGAPANLEQTIAQVKAYRADIGPELARQGITEADLITIESGQDPKGQLVMLQSILANRRALGTFVPGTYAQRGAGGGLATLPTEGAPSAL